MLRLVLAPLLALVALSSTAAAEGPLKLMPDFQPHPYLVRDANAKAEIYMDKLGIRCSGSAGMTSSNPVFTFELGAVFPELVVRFEGTAGGPLVGTSAVIVFPNGGYVCVENQETFRTNWPKGVYKIYLEAYSTGLHTNIRFEIPARTKKDLQAARDGAPAITWDTEAPVHPQRFTLATQAIAENQDVGLKCMKKLDAVTPLATVAVPHEYAKFKLDLLGVTKSQLKSPQMYPPAPEVFLTADDGKTCLGEGGPLAAGKYILWGKVDRDAPPLDFRVEVEDAALPLRFGPGLADVALETYPTPKILDGKVRARDEWPKRDDNCHNPTALQPDFLLVAKEPRQNVRMKLMPSAGEQWLRVFGPLDKMQANNRSVCFDDGHKLEIAEGTYAVWVGGKSPGEEFHLALMDDDTKVERFFMPAEPAANLPMLQRDLNRHFPFWDDMRAEEATKVADARWLFEHAPEALFVYARVDVKPVGNDLALVKGEPLLVVGGGGDRISVIRGDGQHTAAPAQLVGVERPAAGFPAAPFVPEPNDDARAGMDDAGPEDAKAIEAYTQKKDKIETCVDNYLSKHDPTYGTGDRVYRISGGSVVNVGEAVGRQADAACGVSGLDAAEKKLLKALEATRKARWAGLYNAAKARFGAAAAN